jgi:hypothetical protein
VRRTKGMHGQRNDITDKVLRVNFLRIKSSASILDALDFLQTQIRIDAGQIEALNILVPRPRA